MHPAGNPVRRRMPTRCPHRHPMIDVSIRWWNPRSCRFSPAPASPTTRCSRGSVCKRRGRDHSRRNGLRHDDYLNFRQAFEGAACSPAIIYSHAADPVVECLMIPTCAGVGDKFAPG